MNRSNNRLRILYSLMLIVSLLVIINVFLVVVGKVHLRSNTSLEDYAGSVSTINDTIFSSRGKIYDDTGIVVAQDVDTYDIICFLDKDRIATGGVVAYVDDPSYTAKMLAPILDISEMEIYDRLTEDPSLYQTELGAKGRNLSIEKVNQIKAIPNIHGIEFRSSYARYYPYGEDFAPYLLGFAQSDESGKLVGKMGLESYLDSELSGVDGKHIFQQDKDGFILPGMYEYTQEAKNGYDVYLTLDVSIQEALVNSIKEAIEDHGASEAWGAVCEINTGKILAWGQAPSFDPNKLNIDDYNNYGSQKIYEPGSVMKAIIYSAAIDTGNYDGNALYDSDTFYFYGDPPYRTYTDTYYDYVQNWDNSSWGMIPLDYGLIYSSNVATATLLTDYVGPTIYEDYLKRFHFFEYVDTDGILENEGYTNFGISPADSISTTYGQSSATTMLQLLQAYTAIFGNGDMVKPYFIDKIVDSSSNSIVYQGTRTVVGKPIKESTAKQMQDLLRRVVSDEEGTGADYNVESVEAMCKTGTAEIAVDGEYTGNDYVKSAMIGFPYEDPQYMIYFAYHIPTHKDYETKNYPITELLEKTAMLTNTQTAIARANSNSTIVKNNMIDVKDMTFIEANEKLSDFDLDIIRIGNGLNVIGQYPEVNKNVYTNEKVFLLTDGNELIIPDFRGWTRKEIINYWTLSGLSMKLDGYGIVKKQSISPNTVVSKNDELVIYFGDINVDLDDKQ